jgi:predicted RNA-binding Zn ribbon-like protein
LKYALALATPGHPGSDATLAEQRLSALLASADALLPEERMLVTIHLREVEQRLILDSAAAQLRSDSASALEQQNSQSAAELARALEENRRLRAELDDATQKLNALAAIEQSIRERENDSD